MKKKDVAKMIRRSIGARSALGLTRRLERRLAETLPGAFEIETLARGAFTFCGITVRLSERKALDALSKSLDTFLLKDWMPTQMLAVIDAHYPELPPEARLKVLLGAIRQCNSLGPYPGQAKLIRAYLIKEETLILEGFMRFRLKEIFNFWQSCVEHAAESWLLEYETGEFLRLLRAFADVQPPRTGDVTVSATPAGGYQLLDEFGRKIEDEAFSTDAAAAKEDALVSLLVSVAPRRIWVCGCKREAQDAIASVFGSRARFLQD